MERSGVDPEYLELVRPDTLAPVDTIEGETLVAVAARVGRARLIDNTTVRPSAYLRHGEPTTACNA